MIEIPLTQGKVTLVDDEDYERVAKFKYCAHKSYNAVNTFYAVRHIIKASSKSRQLVGIHNDILDVPKGFVVDHINGDGLDNRKENLRVVTHRGNMQNRLKKTSRYPGVCWNKNVRKWQSQINIKGRVWYLGLFVDELEAATAYRVACAVMGLEVII